MMLNNLSVKNKILFLSVVMIVITCIIASIGIFFNSRSQKALDEMYNSNLMATQYLNDANNHFRLIDVDIDYLLLNNEGIDEDVLKDDIIERLERIRSDLDKLKDIVKVESLNETISKLYAHINVSEVAVQETKGLNDKDKLYKNLMTVKAIAADLSLITPENVSKGKELFIANNDRYKLSIRIFAFIVIIGLLFGISAAIIIARDISDPLSRSIEELNQISKGNLTQKLPEELINRGDEVGTVVNALSQMQMSLVNTLKSVQEDAEDSKLMSSEVKELVNQLNEHTQDMSATTEQMAAGTEETAAVTSDIQQLSVKVNEDLQLIVERLKESKEYAKAIYQRAEGLGLKAEESAVNAKNIYETEKAALERSIKSVSEIMTKEHLTKGITKITEELINTSIALLTFIETKVSKDYDEMIKIAEQYKNDAEYFKTWLETSNENAAKFATNVNEMTHALEEIANATHENAIGNTRIAERVALMAENAQEILNNMNELDKNAKQLMEQVERFKIN